MSIHPLSQYSQQGAYEPQKKLIAIWLVRLCIDKVSVRNGLELLSRRQGTDGTSQRLPKDG